MSCTTNSSRVVAFVAVLLAVCAVVPASAATADQCRMDWEATKGNANYDNSVQCYNNVVISNATNPSNFFSGTMCSIGCRTYFEKQRQFCANNGTVCGNHPTSTNNFIRDECTLLNTVATNTVNCAAQMTAEASCQAALDEYTTNCTNVTGGIITGGEVGRNLMCGLFRNGSTCVDRTEQVAVKCLERFSTIPDGSWNKVCDVVSKYNAAVQNVPLANSTCNIATDLRRYHDSSFRQVYKPCKTQAEIEKERVNACGVPYDNGKPNALETWNKDPESCEGENIHDMMCFDNNLTKTVCQQAKKDVYQLCVNLTLDCAFNDTRNLGADYAKDCNHVVKITEGTMACDAPSPSPPPPPFSPSPPPSPSPPSAPVEKPAKKVVIDMVIEVKKVLDETHMNQLKENAEKAGSEVNVSVTYGTTVGGMFTKEPTSAEVTKETAAAFNVKEAQVISVVMFNGADGPPRSRKLLGYDLTKQEELKDTNPFIVQVTVASPDYQTAKSMEPTAAATSEIGFKKIDPAAQNAMVFTSAIVSYEMTWREDKSEYLSPNALLQDVGGDAVGEVFQRPSTPVDKPTTTNPPTYVKPAGSAGGPPASDSGASSRSVAAYAVAVLAAVLALFLA